MRYVALLRGINVGGNRRVEMPRLKSAFENAGFKDVVTYINSGNVVFSAPKNDTLFYAGKIEKAVEKEFGFLVETLIIGGPRFEKICQDIPLEWTNDSRQRTDVLFVWNDISIDHAIQNIITNPDVDEIVASDGAIIWHLDRQNLSQSKMKDLIKNPLYKQMTVRNSNTVRKLFDMINRSS